MKQRGRQANPETTGLTVIEGDFGRKRPEPPSTLTERQAAIWVETVEDEPLELFATAATRDMLRDYCAARSTIDSLTDSINQFPESALKTVKGLQHFTGLCKTRDINIRSAATLATKLRMTNQSRYTEKTAGTAASNTKKGLKPWDFAAAQAAAKPK